MYLNWRCVQQPTYHKQLWCDDVKALPHLECNLIYLIIDLI